MAEFEEVRSAFKRMCDYHGVLPMCAGCPVLESKIGCNKFLLEEPNAESIVMQWAREHKPKSNNKKGYWQLLSVDQSCINYDYMFNYRCSCCGNKFLTFSERSLPTECPNCSAKMFFK